MICFPKPFDFSRSVIAAATFTLLISACAQPDPNTSVSPQARAAFPERLLVGRAEPSPAMERTRRALRDGQRA
ncbi:MAG: hypothetical protein AAF360_09160 [Pseudomonadota bacterium]